MEVPRSAAQEGLVLDAVQLPRTTSAMVVRLPATGLNQALLALVIALNLNCARVLHEDENDAKVKSATVF